MPAMLSGVSAPAEATAILAHRLRDVLRRSARARGTAGRPVRPPACAARGLCGVRVGRPGRGERAGVVQLVTARGLQGAAAAISVPRRSAAAAGATPQPEDRRGALAAWSATGAAAGALGLLVGGALTDSLGWRAVFWVNVPVGILLVLAIRLVVPRSAPDGDATRLDPSGPAS